MRRNIILFLLRFLDRNTYNQLFIKINKFLKNKSLVTDAGKTFSLKSFFKASNTLLSFKLKLGNFQNHNELLPSQPLSVGPHDDSLVPDTESCQDSQTDKNSGSGRAIFYLKFKLQVRLAMTHRQFYQLTSYRELSEKNQYNLPPIFCKIGVFYTVLCMVSSVMTLSAISCDRFLAVICPLRTRVTQRKAR